MYIGPTYLMWMESVQREQVPLERKDDVAVVVVVVIVVVVEW
jgi:hypothetical protein